MKDEKEEHESWGIAGFHRVNGNFKERLFATNVDTGTAIALRISECSNRRSLHNNHYYDGKTVCEVYFSPAQFAELLTSMNIGSGVPCTITRRHTENFKTMEKPPVTPTETAQIIDEFKGKVKDLFNIDVSRAKEILSEKRLNMTHKAELLEMIHQLNDFATNHATFAADQFEEAAGKIVVEAKAEIDATVSKVIMKTGIDALAEKKEKMLAESEET